jgi:hypothetical protein
MPNESKTLTDQRICTEKALAGLRELQLAEAEGALLRAAAVEAAWSNAMLAIPTRCGALRGLRIRKPPKRSFATKWRLRCGN